MLCAFAPVGSAPVASPGWDWRPASGGTVIPWHLFFNSWLIAALALEVWRGE